MLFNLGGGFSLPTSLVIQYLQPFFIVNVPQNKIQNKNIPLVKPVFWLKCVKWHLHAKFLLELTDYKNPYCSYCATHIFTQQYEIYVTAYIHSVLFSGCFPYEINCKQFVLQLMSSGVQSVNQKKKNTHPRYNTFQSNHDSSVNRHSEIYYFIKYSIKSMSPKESGTHILLISLSSRTVLYGTLLWCRNVKTKWLNMISNFGKVNTNIKTIIVRYCSNTYCTQ